MNVEMQVMRGESVVIEAEVVTHAEAVEALAYYGELGVDFRVVCLAMWGGHTIELVPGPECAWLCRVCGSEVGDGEDEGCPHCWME